MAFHSNIEAEYEALIARLEILLELGAKDVEIKGDSKLVIKQLTKEYKCVKENLIIYFATTTALLKRFDRENIQHVPGIENQEANDLAQIDSGYIITKIKFNDFINWLTPIVEYLQNPTGDASRKTKYRALSYVIIGNELFKKSPEGVLL